MDKKSQVENCIYYVLELENCYCSSQADALTRV